MPVDQLKPHLVIILVLAWLGSSIQVRAQITGTSSLVTIPVADMPSDGTISVGVGFVDKRYSDYLGGRVDYTPYYVSAAFLPFFEVAFRFSRPVDLDDRERLGDRMVSARLQILPETARRPAIVVGAHDFLTVEERNYFNALYVVASKHFEAFAPVSLHIGYGADMMEARAYQFAGIFGGISVSVFPTVEILAEYDGDRPNAGARVTFFKSFKALVALQNMDTLQAGASVSVEL